MLLVVAAEQVIHGVLDHKDLVGLVLHLEEPTHLVAQEMVDSLRVDRIMVTVLLQQKTLVLVEVVDLVQIHQIR
jgi:hypothetical protein